MTWILISLGAVLLIALIVLLIRQQRLSAQLSESQTSRGESQTALSLLQQQLEAMREQMQKHQEGSVQLLQRQWDSLEKQLGERFKDSHELVAGSQKNVNDRLDTAAKVVGQLQGKLGRLEEANERLLEVGQSLQSLQDILKTPKLRGNLGEYFLADLLNQILPKEHFELQHAFSNHEKVDAAIKLGDKWVSVDAKFPLENFQRYLNTQSEDEKKSAKKTFVSDVRKHIDAIAAKYIRPDEGTYDFALMYVPAENLYYEMVIKEEIADGATNLIERAMQKRVIPVSPNTLYVYLNTIVFGLKGLQIEKTAQKIFSGLTRLTQELGRLQENFRKVGGHLQHARSAFDSSEQRLNRFTDRMEKLSQTSVASSASEESKTLSEADEKLHLIPTP